MNSELIFFGVMIIVSTILILRKMPVWVVIFFMSSSIIFFSEVSAGKVIEASYFMFGDRKFIDLLVNIFFIFSFGSLIKKSGHLERLGEKLALVFPERVAVTFLPMIMGFFPMPGGALFTVDFVKHIGSRKDISKEILSFANYWFRHVWEFVYPLYPGFILYYSLLEITPYDIFRKQVLFTLIMIISGYIVIFRNTDNHSFDWKTSVRNFHVLLKDLWFTGIIFLFIFMKYPVYLALMLCCIIVVLSHRMKIKDVFSSIRKSISPEVLLTIYMVYFFQRILEISLISGRIQSFIGNMPDSALVICVVFPFITGYLTGITTSYVGICFPILLPFFSVNEWFAVIAYTSGFAGVLLTPVHLCLSLTVNSFRTDFRKVYLFIIPLSAILILTSIVLYFIF